MATHLWSLHTMIRRASATATFCSAAGSSGLPWRNTNCRQRVERQEKTGQHDLQLSCRQRPQPSASAMHISSLPPQSWWMQSSSLRLPPSHLPCLGAKAVLQGHHLAKQLLHLQLAALHAGEMAMGLGRAAGARQAQAHSCLLPCTGCPACHLTCCVSTTTTPPLSPRLAAHSWVRMRVSWAMPREDSHHARMTVWPGGEASLASVSSAGRNGCGCICWPHRHQSSRLFAKAWPHRHGRQQQRHAQQHRHYYMVSR